MLEHVDLFIWKYGLICMKFIAKTINLKSSKEWCKLVWNVVQKICSDDDDGLE